MTTEEKIVQALENLQAGQERLEKTVGVVQADVKDIKHTQQEQGEAIKQQGAELKQQGSVINHIATAIKALATKQDIERVEKEVDKLKERLRPPRAD
jgi:peptidoglycan hydrolase CwlO-like protein